MATAFNYPPGLMMPMVKAIVIMDMEGKRIASKFFDKAFSDEKSQTALEKKVIAKIGRATTRADADAIAVDNVVVVYKHCTDAVICVVGGDLDNELINLSVLTCFEASLATLIRGGLSKRALSENLDIVLLVIDEMIDHGLLMETDWQAVVERASMSGAERNIPLSEQTLSQAFVSAREQLIKSFR